MSLHANILRGYVEAKKMLRISNLFHSENTTRKFTFNFSKFSVDFLKELQSDDYFKIYEVGRKRNDYDILLKDQSFFQFSFDEKNNEINRIRYAYFDSPTNTKSYEEFLDEIEIDISECGDYFYDYYEQYLSEAKLKTSVNPIRYDYDEGLYKEVFHPVSHLHVGHQNEIRIPCESILSPKGFVAFVIRHVYREDWIKTMNDESFLKVYETIKSSPNVNSSYFGNSEKKDFFIM
jgi:hypothetical protein